MDPSRVKRSSDFEQSHGIALSFTSDPAAHDEQFYYCTTLEQEVRQSILLILTTVPGTRPKKPEYGCRLHEVVFRPMSPATIAAARFFITQSLARWEPRITDLTISILKARLDDDGPGLSISLKYRLSQQMREVSNLELTGQLWITGDPSGKGDWHAAN